MIGKSIGIHCPKEVNGTIEFLACAKINSPTTSPTEIPTVSPTRGTNTTGDKNVSGIVVIICFFVVVIVTIILCFFYSRKCEAKCCPVVGRRISKISGQIDYLMMKEQTYSFF